MRTALIPAALAEVLMLAALILANGYFAAAEIAVIAARRGRLQQQADAGDHASRLALDLAAQPGRFLSTVQVGITLVSTFAAAFGGARIAHYLSDVLARAPLTWVVQHREALALALVVLVISFASLVFGELVPKRLALRHAELFARWVARPMKSLEFMTTPVVWFMQLVTDQILKLFGSVPSAHDSEVSVEDIEHLIKAGATQGIFEQAEQDIALGALKLSERTVRDIMRPRIELDAIDIHTPADEVVGTVAMAGFSRLPVYDGDLDHILGFIHIKDLFRQQYLGWPIELRKLLHSALFVPESLPLDRLLERFQQQQTQLAVVLDEFGGTEGVVTLEDVVQELVGEIRDEHDRDRQQAIVPRDEHSWLVDGRVNLDQLHEELKLKLPRVDGPRGYSTLAGLIMDQLGRVPSVGDRTPCDDCLLEVVDMDGPRIDRVLITKNSPQPSGETPAASPPTDS